MEPPEESLKVRHHPPGERQLRAERAPRLVVPVVHPVRHRRYHPGEVRHHHARRGHQQGDPASCSPATACRPT
uniref:Uncharacterized protein n=1 Tax=Oryza nivara TaxID=4536 RepID=A0A0E0HT71_ORYNI